MRFGLRYITDREMKYDIQGRCKPCAEKRGANKQSTAANRKGMNRSFKGWGWKGLGEKEVADSVSEHHYCCCLLRYYYFCCYYYDYSAPQTNSAGC
jgi:hypothetical protein